MRQIHVTNRSHTQNMFQNKFKISNSRPLTADLDMQTRYFTHCSCIPIVNTDAHITVHIVWHRSEDCYWNCDERYGEDEEEKTVHVASAKEHVSDEK